MKLCRIFALLGALVASTIPSAFAAAPTIKAQVPFAFMVGNRKMPAGEYTVVASNSASAVFYIRGAGQAVAVLSSPLESTISESKNPEMVFQTRGSQRYLVGVRMDGEPGRSIAEPSFRQAGLDASR